MKKFLLVLVVLGTAMALVLPAYGGGRDGFRSDLMGSQPGQPIRTVSSGGVPWTMEDGSGARLTEDGRLRADIRGLLITGTGTTDDGTTGKVTGVVAALTCANPATGDTGPPTILNSSTASLSSKGDARIDQQIAVPTTCLAPIVLIRANGDSGPWIAASGF